MRILFVCTGNICRSPMAEGALARHAAEAGLGVQIRVDSAGTHDYNLGLPPDPRAQRAAARRGIDISAHRARQVTENDFESFDLILAMDGFNMANLRSLCPPAHRDKLNMALRFARDRPEMEVDDPYAGGQQGFEVALDLIEAAVRGLLAEIRRGPPGG